MGLVAVILGDGFEEIEALTVIDLLRRADIEVNGVSIMGRKEVIGSRRINVIADSLLEDLNEKDIDMLVLPGGMGGRDNMAACKPLTDMLISFNKEGKKIAAICAAPSVLGRLGITKGLECVSYPDDSIENELIGRVVPEMGVSTITDGNITTSMGPATAMEFALELIRVIKDEKVAETVADGLLY